MIKRTRIPISVNLNVGGVGSTTYNGIAEAKTEKDGENIKLIGIYFNRAVVRDSIEEAIVDHFRSNLEKYHQTGKTILYPDDQ